MRHGWKILSGALLALTLALPVSAQDKEKKSGGRPPTAVGLDAVKSEPLRQTVPVIGRFVPRQSGVVAARVAGPVESYAVEVGDRVEKGDVLAELIKSSFVYERNRYKAEVASARAVLQTSRETLSLLNQELDRLEGLRKSPAFSQARYDDKEQETIRAKSEIAEARALLQSAEADLDLANLGVHNATIRAPYGGVITQRHSEAGAYLSVGDPVVALIDYTSLEIEADVPANRVDGLDKGRGLDARLEDGTPLRAIVRAVIPDENPRTRTRRVRFVTDDLDNTKGTAANQSVTVDVPAGEVRDVLTVHKDAILNRGGGRLVVLYVDGKAEFRPVQLGQAVGTRFVINSGLQLGDRVVIRGNERLRPGQAIRNGDSES